MKDNKKSNNKVKKNRLPLDGIMGILLLFVVASVAYSSYVVWVGVDGTISRVMLVPQMVFASLILVKKFTK